MYSIGDYVIHKSRGLCRIVDIATLDFDDVDRNRLYYFMIPEGSTSSRIYVPVESAEAAFRKPITREAALKLIDELPYLDDVKIEIEKQRENIYKDAIKDDDCRELFRLIRTTHRRRADRMAHGRKSTAIDERYMKAAEDVLYGELSYSLKVDRKDIDKFITQRLEGSEKAIS